MQVVALPFVLGGVLVNSAVGEKDNYYSSIFKDYAEGAITKKVALTLTRTLT